MRIIGVSTVAFIAAILTLILIPREATRSAARLLEGTADRPDTVLLTRQLDRAQIATAAAELTLARHRARRRERQLHPAAFDSLAAASAAGQPRTRRDSVVAMILELNHLIARTERSPLTASYRDLGAAAALRNDPRVPVLLDSLGDVERARTAFDAAGGVDPIFVALTARVNAIGHALQAVADAKRSALRKQLDAMGGGPAVPATLIAAADTVAPRARLDSARQAMSTLTTAIDRARALDAALDTRTERAREIANESAPPIALMGAALVLGLAAGFAVTFGLELRRPRVADGAEAERVAGVPTLATVGPHTPDPQRTRRQADLILSPLIDVNSEAYRYAYLRVRESVAARARGMALVAVTGDEPEIVATVATNVAIAAVHDSRTTLLIDADPAAAAVAGIVGIARAPGVSDVLGRRLDWSAAIVSAVVGRDHGLDVIPAGERMPTHTTTDPAAAIAAGFLVSADVIVERVPSADNVPSGDELSAGVNIPEDEGLAVGGGRVEGAPTADRDRAGLRAELLRLGRRYELIVVAAPAGAVSVGPDSILPVPDAIVCARIAYTTLTRLAASVAALRESGLAVRGVVLWNADGPPRLTGES